MFFLPEKENNKLLIKSLVISQVFARILFESFKSLHKIFIFVENLNLHHLAQLFTGKHKEEIRASPTTTSPSRIELSARLLDRSTKVVTKVKIYKFHIHQGLLEMVL